MSLFESYLFLLFDSIMATLLLVSNTGMVYDAMTIFGGYNYFYMVAIAIVGSVIGASLNYLLGRILRSVKKNIKYYADSDKLIALSQYANSRLILLSLFSFLTLFGVIITTAAGFLNVSFKRFILLVTIGRAAYYLLPILI